MMIIPVSPEYSLNRAGQLPIAQQPDRKKYGTGYGLKDQCIGGKWDLLLLEPG